jgi:hypothetical protein
MQNWNSLSCLAPGGVCNKAPLASGDDERQIPTNARSWRLCCFRLRQLSEGFRAFPRNRQGRLRVEFTRSPSRRGMAAIAHSGRSESTPRLRSAAVVDRRKATDRCRLEGRRLASREGSDCRVSRA